MSIWESRESTRTCGTCGRECLPDGDCYGCEADRQRGLATALAEASNMWRAQAEALAEFLREFHLCNNTKQCRGCAVLARLPADALAERRAVERCADLLGRFRARWPQPIPVDAPGERTHSRVLSVQDLREIDAALDAARKRANNAVPM